MSLPILPLRVILSLLLLCSGKFAFSQSEAKYLIAQAYSGSGLVPMEEGRYYQPAYKHISVFSKAYTLSDVVYKTQSFADSLLVTDVLEEQYVKHKNTYSYWCKVTYTQNGKKGTGYVPGQLLTPLALRNGADTYLLILEKYEQRQFFFSLKVLHNYELSFQHSFVAPSQDSYFPFEQDTGAAFFSGDADLQLFNNRGLKKIDNIVHVGSGIGACGYWNGAKLFLLYKGAIKQTLEEGGVSDAGVFYHSEDYLFPSDSLGKKKHLIKQITHYEALNEQVAEEWTSRIKYRFKHYQLIPKDSICERRTIKLEQ